MIRGGYGIYYAGVVMSQFLASPTFGYSSNPTVTDLTNGRQAAFNWGQSLPAGEHHPTAVYQRRHGKRSECRNAES